MKNNLKLITLINIDNSMRYTLQDYSDVLFTGYKYELPENTQNIIKNLTKELGVVIAAAAIAAATVTQKPDDYFKQSNPHYNKRNKSDYRFKLRTDDSWKGAPVFKATKIEKKEGANVYTKFSKNKMKMYN